MACLAAVLAVATTCRRGEAPDVVATGSDRVRAVPPEVDVSGCQGFSAERPRCRLPSDDARLHLWIGSTSVPAIELDDRPAVGTLRPTVGDHGWTASIVVPASATLLSIREANGGDLAHDGAERWTLELERMPPTPTVDRIEAALPEMNSQDRTPHLLAGIARLEAALPTVEAHERFRALRLATILALDAGEIDKGLQLGRRALDEAVARGELGDAISIGEILFHTHQDPADKDWILGLLDVWTPIAGDGIADVKLRYLRGFRAMQRLDVAQALDDLAASERRARRLGLSEDELVAAGTRASLLTQLGDEDASAAARARILELVGGRSRTNACTDAHVVRDAAWTLVAQRLIGDLEPDPRPLLARVAAYYEPGGGCSPGDNPLLVNRYQSARLDIVRDALTRGDLARTRALVDAIDRETLSDLNRRWLAYVEGALALANGEPRRTLELTENLELATTNNPLMSWKSALLRSDAALALGDHDAALRHALAAEAVLDQTSGQLAPDQGREVLAAAFRASAARAVDLQIAKGDLSGATRSARRARARQLRPVGSAVTIARLSPEARARHQDARARYRVASERLKRELTELWRLPVADRIRAGREHAELQEAMRVALKDADAALRDGASEAGLPTSASPGELTLLYHPLPDGWIAFAISTSGIESHRFTLPSSIDDEFVARELLTPFAESIESAQRLRILATGELLPIRFHAAPWNGAPLVVAKPVAYGLDVDGTSSLGTASRKALVIADPATRLPGLGRLPQARDEGAAVAQALRSSGWSVVELFEDAAEHGRVVQALAEADWLHYAGHGLDVGKSGWQSGLPLAGEASLEIADILSARAVPPAVILSACDTAGTPTHVHGRMQISTSFLLGGAQFVIAAQGGVADDAAPRFSSALYRGGLEALDGPTLARNAVLALRAEGEPMSTWAGFFVWVR